MAAVASNAPLPGDDPPACLYDIDLPYKTHLEVLRRATQRATRDGLFTAKLLGDRALFVTDINGYTARGWTGDKWSRAVHRRFTAALRRAGIGDDRQWHVMATSRDSVSGFPVRVPFAAYGFPLWTSEAEPGPVHDITAARLHALPGLYHAAAHGLPTLADPRL